MMYLMDGLMVVIEVGFFNNVSGKGKLIVVDFEVRNFYIGE